jgi:RNA recognition motif-containing protein
MAKSIVHRFAGTYWKNATLNARCVPDQEIEKFLEESRRRRLDREGAVGEHEMLFVSGIHPNTSWTEVRDIFKDFALRKINVPDGGKPFCFIFARPEDTNAILMRFGQGVQYGNRLIRVSLSKKSKKKEGGPPNTGGGATYPPPAQMLPTTDLKINNLPFDMTFNNIHYLFGGFKISKVIIKKGYAFVAVASTEADQAVKALNGTMVGNRKTHGVRC